MATELRAGNILVHAALVSLEISVHGDSARALLQSVTTQSISRADRFFEFARQLRMCQCR